MQGGSLPSRSRRRCLTPDRLAPHIRRMSLLLPQTRSGTVRSAATVSIHGDRYVDVVIALDDESDGPFVGRVGAHDFPAALTPGERVKARFVMGVLVGVTREGGSDPVAPE